MLEKCTEFRRCFIRKPAIFLVRNCITLTTSKLEMVGLKILSRRKILVDILERNIATSLTCMYWKMFVMAMKLA